MAQRNPAISSLVVGNVSLYYKDLNEAFTYSVGLSGLLAAGETVDIDSVIVTVAPNDLSIDFSSMADETSITIYVDVGGTEHETYEFTILFDSNLGNSYVDYMRMSVKQVYKTC